MFVTMDVVFHEDSMYFSSEPELQGEHLEEVQALDYDFLISIEGELSELGNNLNGNVTPPTRHPMGCQARVSHFVIGTL